MNASKSKRFPGAQTISLLIACLTLVGTLSLTSLAPEGMAAQSASDKISSAAGEAGQKVQEAGQAAKDKVEQWWKQIDERRLSKRTLDEIVAWVIMGLLVGGVLSRMTKVKPFTAIFLGLAGAFVGGLIAHVSQFDLGLGPVLIRYEDLLFALGGGLILLLIGRWFTAPKEPKT